MASRGMAVVDCGDGDAGLSTGIAMLKVTFDNMRHGFLLLDEEWRVVEFNSLMIELVGYPAEIVRRGARAYDLVCAGASLGHYRG